MDFFGFDILSLFTLTNLFAIVIGTLVGLIIGALPGLGAPVAIVLLLPITFTLSPLAAILLLVAAYQAAEYGGSISAIILGIPGIPAAAATVIDGNALARKGAPGQALIYSLSAATIGGLTGGLVLIFLSIPLATFALNLSEPEYFLVGVLGLIAVASLSSKDIVKNLISVILGLMAATVGIDSFTREPRFTMGFPEFMQGMDIIPLLVGLFAFSELFKLINQGLQKKSITDLSGLKIKISFKKLRKVFKSMSIGSIIGSGIGVFPGMNAAASSFFAYAASKKFSKHPEKFGTGSPEGIAAPESANSASVGGSLVPLLALGIPGSPTVAIIMGAFLIHGIQIGPGIFQSDMTLVNGIFYGFLLTTVMLLLVGLLVTPMFARILMVPSPMLVPTVLILSIVGVFVANSMFFDLWLALIVGVIAYFLRILDFSIPSFILAFVLAPIIEDSFRRALVLSEGSYTIFITRPYSIVLLLIIAAIIIVSLLNWYKRRKAIQVDYEKTNAS